MNPVFVELLKLNSSIRPFLEWYNMKYPNQLAIFQNLPFSHQIGAYIEYFETMYKLVILVNTKGFTIHFTDSRHTPLDAKNMFKYYHHKYEHTEPKTVMHGYELGIVWLFKNYDLPF